MIWHLLSYFGYRSLFSEVNNRSIWVGFPTGAHIFIFFYAEDGEDMFLRIFGQFVVVYTLSRRRKHRFSEFYLFSGPAFSPPSVLFTGYWGSFTEGWSGQGVKLRTYLHLIQRLRMNGAYLHSPICLLVVVLIQRSYNFSFVYAECLHSVSFYHLHKIQHQWDFVCDIWSYYSGVVEDWSRQNITPCRLVNTVEPGYNDIVLCDTPYIASGILWYQLIPHC
jgi:hypothetical protein